MRLAVPLVLALVCFADATARLPRDQLLLYRAEGGPRPVRSADDWAKRRAEIVAGFEAIAGKFPAAKDARRACALGVRVEEEFDAGTYVRRLVTYQAEPGGRVPAYLLVPKDALKGKKLPAVLCLHGTDDEVGHGTVVGLGKRPNRNYAEELAKRGYVTLAPSYPLLAKYRPDLKALGWQSGTMKAVYDNSRGVDLLASLPYVDAARVGAVGHSLGGHNAVFTAVFDERIKAVVSSCGLDSFLDYYDGDEKHWQPEKGWCQTRYLPKLAGYKGKLEQIPFDFHELVAALAPRHVLIVAPKKDTNFRVESVERVVKAARPVYALLRAEDRLATEYPDCAHDFPPEMRQKAYALFDEVLADAPAKGAKKVEPRLAEGKFGKALDAAVTPLAFAGDERYRQVPLTVECWALLRDKRAFNVLASSDPKPSSRHWEVYSYAKTGHFAAYLPGYEPSEVVSKRDVCDGKWHHLALTFDGNAAKLYVDGKLVREQAVVARQGAKPKDGPLSIGQALDGGERVGCNGLIDDVRISRVIRDVSKLPAGPLAVDKDTVALWQFDGADRVLADPEWTPPPTQAGEAWERMTDADWVDVRLRKMDTGPTFDATFAYQHDGKRQMVYRGTAVRVGEKGEAALIFDRNQLRWAAGWTGAYLNHSDRRFGLLNTPTPAGKMAFATTGPGWTGPNEAFASTHPTTAPLPTAWGRYKGLSLHGKRAVVSYEVNGCEVRESPWVETVGGHQAIVRTVEVGPTKGVVGLLLDEWEDKSPSPTTMTTDDPLVCLRSLDRTGDRVALVAGVGIEKLQFLREKGNRAWVTLEPHDRPRRFRLYHWQGPKGDAKAVLAALGKSPAALDLSKLTEGGPGRYPTPLVTKGERAKDDAPHVVDTLTIPYDNPHDALFFCTGHDFLPDGRIAMCTAHGDVWLVKHDDALEKVEWRRFATGLYQPLGLKVVAGKVVVLERGQLTRLHDQNGDGEADFYENLSDGWHVGGGEHSYHTCLETDSQGNFYFFATGDTNLPTGGCLMKASRDGKRVETFATGFRHPIGLGVSPTDDVTGADQEGNWMPMTRLDVYKKGGFYGDMRAHHRKEAPKTYDGPLCWMPKEVDNSAGGQAWVPHEKFGLPKGQMLHLSYGRCKLYSVLKQSVDGVEQAGVVDLGLRFLSGSARARFSPKDGHLYVCGLNGWQTAAKRDGSLQRVRYTGKPVEVPTSLAFTKEGVRLGFARPVDAKKAADKGSYRVTAWGYRWSQNYGSARYSVKEPGRVGTDEWEVTSARVSEDGRSVTLAVKGMTPAMQVRVAYDVGVSGVVHGTIHRLGER